ncbi:MAG TPA: hypothetical protein PKH39_15225 [Woeseiaceae bacterium]|nr:hypothetical protein [Woeseiaceae bacterium]
MADAIFLQIINAVIAELNTNRPTDIPEASTRRTIPGEVLEEPRIAVFLGDESVDTPRANSNSDPLARRRLPIAVQCAAPSELAAELDLIVAPMLIWSAKVLGRNRLGGLVHYFRETATQRRTEYLDVAVMTATQIFECSYQTRRDDLTVRI